MGLIKSAPQPHVRSGHEQKLKPHVDLQFLPFLSHGFLLTGEENDKVLVTILRDTGAYSSLLESAAFI